MSQNSYHREFCAQLSQMVFLADLTVLRLVTTVWAKMWQISNLRKYCAKVSEIAFLAELTVLRLIPTVWTKMSQNSYLREFCAQVWQIVFWVDLTVLQLITKNWKKNVTKLIYPRVLCTSITNRVRSWFYCFTAYYNCMSKHVKSLISAQELCTSFKIVFLADSTVLRLLTAVWAKSLQTSHLREFCEKVSQILFLADFTVLRLITTVWAKMSINSLLREFCA